MNNNYLCPNCKGLLNVEQKIIFSAVTNKRKGIVMLSPEIGNYTISKNPDFLFEKGDYVQFYCPLCSSFLDSNVDSNLATIIMKDKNDNEFEIIFSKIAGEQSTYKRTFNHESTEAYGKDSSHYINYFGSL